MMKKTADPIVIKEMTVNLNCMDMTLLREQKKVLVRMMFEKVGRLTGEEIDTIEGIVNLLDVIQDHAIDNLGHDKYDILDLSKEDEELDEDCSLPYSQWEGAVIDLIEELCDCTRSDAQGIVEAQDFYMTQSWTKGLTPAETAKLIDEKSKA
jgi:hypothetical protein